MRCLKKITAAVLSGILFLSMPPSAMAGGVNPWAAAASALGAAVAYKTCLTDILRLGNNAWNQELTRRHDEQEQGLSPSVNDRKLVDEIMTRLAEQGQYELDIRSLPFRWQVNANREFNACCYPTNYISVNSGLMSGLCRNREELAAVLAHEMTHGIEQHSAYNYAKAVAQFYGLTFLNIATGVMDGAVLNVLADYSIAKNVTLPAEYVADEGGFYIAASAGFNPGGGAAAMSRLAYCSTHLEDFSQEFEPYDHPDTDKREIRLSKLMTEYSCNHVEVRDGKNICIDGIKLMTMSWTSSEYDNTSENAHLAAGGLAKAFHDFSTVDEWHFLQAENGRITYLDDNPVYEPLKYWVERNHAEDLLWKLVNHAYNGEAASGERERQRIDELNRTLRWRERHEENLVAKKERIKELRLNSDIYVDLGLMKLANYQINRFFASKTEEDTASIYSVIGRSHAYSGDFENGLAACNHAIELDSKNAFNYLNRADIYRAQGMPEPAIADCLKAIEADPKNGLSYKLAADIYDELGNKDEARKNYQMYKNLIPNAEDIPAEYVENKKK